MYSTKPKYTSLKNFQDVIDDNALSIMSNTTEISYTALTRKATEFTAVNSTVAFIIPTNPGNVPTPPANIGTRASTAVLTGDSTATVEKSDPYKPQEAIRIFQDKNRNTTVTTTPVQPSKPVFLMQLMTNTSEL